MFGVYVNLPEGNHMNLTSAHVFWDIKLAVGSLSRWLLEAFATLVILVRNDVGHLASHIMVISPIFLHMVVAVGHITCKLK